MRAEGARERAIPPWLLSAIRLRARARHGATREP
jgi:hypothetical protein